MTLPTPLISIITVCRNADKTIAQTLQSVAEQKDVNGYVEHLVIDGASTDNTLKIIKGFPHVKYLSEPDEGIADAFNKGIRNSRGRWILFLNADDFLHDQYVLSKADDYLNKASDNNIVFGQVEMVSQDTHHSLGRFGKKGLEKMLCLRMVIPHQATFMNRSYFDKYGLFDISYKIGMDYELILRGYKSAQFVFIPVIISDMRDGGVAISSGRKVLQERMQAQIRHRVGGVLWPYFIRLFYEIRMKVFTNSSFVRNISGNH